MIAWLVFLLHVCRNLDVDSLVIDLWELLDHVSVRDLILHYSSMGIVHYVIGNTFISIFRPSQLSMNH